VSGYVISLAGGAIFWFSKKQSCVAASTMEAEYISMAEVSKEVLWIMTLLDP